MASSKSCCDIRSKIFSLLASGDFFRDSVASTAFVSMGLASELSGGSNREGMDAIMVLFWSLCVRSLMDVVNDGDGRLCVESKKV